MIMQFFFKKQNLLSFLLLFTTFTVTIAKTTLQEIQQYKVQMQYLEQNKTFFFYMALLLAVIVILLVFYTHFSIKKGKKTRLENKKLQAKNIEIKKEYSDIRKKFKNLENEYHILCNIESELRDKNRNLQEKLVATQINKIITQQETTFELN